MKRVSAVIVEADFVWLAYGPEAERAVEGLERRGAGQHHVRSLALCLLNRQLGHRPRDSAPSPGRMDCRVAETVQMYRGWIAAWPADHPGADQLVSRAGEHTIVRRMQRVAALAHRAAAAQRGCQPGRPMPPPERLHQKVAYQRPLTGARMILIQQF